MGALNKIIILHGWTYSLGKWDGFVKLLRNLGFDVEVLKIPGLTLENEEVWDLDKYSIWLRGRLSKEEDKVVLLGHSNGGRVASYFAAKFPAKIKKLILVDTAGIYHRETALEIKRFLFGVAAKIGKRITNSNILRKFLYRLAREKDYQEASPTMRKTMLNLINNDLTPEFKKISIPTLIIWGEDDRITPLSDGQLINKLIKNSKLKIVKGARHSPFYTHAGEVVRIIKDDI
jgi:pimeloyl-ACP methyl ester carboxylesterase